MYDDAKRWGYLFQSYVLLTMMELHHKEVVSFRILVCIYAPINDFKWYCCYAIGVSLCDVRKKCL